MSYDALMDSSQSYTSCADVVIVMGSVYETSKFSW